MKSVVVGVVAAGIAATGSLSACVPAPSALPGIKAPYCTSAPVVKPSLIVIACGDGNLQATKIAYQTYGTTAATATATMEANDCIPYCAAGHFHPYPAKLSFSDVQAGRFTRVVVSYTAAVPFGQRVQTIALW